jgi:hypothetical protein
MMNDMMNMMGAMHWGMGLIGLLILLLLILGIAALVKYLFAPKGPTGVLNQDARLLGSLWQGG